MKITCNVIEDLLPLYTDDVLSEDSRKLVDEHLKGCPECQSSLREMNESVARPVSEQEDNSFVNDEKKALRKIKRKIRNRRILTALIVAVVVFFVAIGIDQYYHFHERYITLDKSGLYVEDNKLFSTKSTEGRLKTYLSPDQTVEFIYMGESLYARRTYKDTGSTQLIRDFDEIWSGQSEDLGISVPAELEKVYYVPRDQLDKIGDAWDVRDPEQAAEIIRGVEEKSTLLWER